MSVTADRLADTLLFEARAESEADLPVGSAIPRRFAWEAAALVLEWITQVFCACVWFYAGSSTRSMCCIRGE